MPVAKQPTLTYIMSGHDLPMSMRRLSSTDTLAVDPWGTSYPLLFPAANQCQVTAVSTVSLSLPPSLSSSLSRSLSLSLSLTLSLLLCF